MEISGSVSLPFLVSLFYYTSLSSGWLLMEAERLRLVDSMTGVCLGSFVTVQLVGDFVDASLVQAFPNEKNRRGSRWIIVGLEFGTVTSVLRGRLNPPHTAPLEMAERREESSEVRKGRWTSVCYPISGIRV